MKLPDAHFGRFSTQRTDWRKADPDVDPDDEEIETPPDVVMMLGFDPAEVGDGQGAK
jgi:hypothetical protein